MGCVAESGAESPVLAECREAYVARQVAKDRWTQSVLKAKDAGESNVAIARAVGVSEGSIRMLLVRREVEHG